jgi:Skp family chaperone for outer membrane proteins
MGTLRWQKERTEAEAGKRLEAEYERHRAAIAEELAEMEARVQTLQRSIVTKRLAQDSIKNQELNRKEGDTSRHSEMIRLRQADELGISEATRLAPTEKPADDESRP